MMSVRSGFRLTISISLCRQDGILCLRISILTSASVTGTCSYVCPAKLKIASEITRGKMELVQYMNAKKEKEQNEEVRA